MLSHAAKGDHLSFCGARGHQEREMPAKIDHAHDASIQSLLPRSPYVVLWDKGLLS